ncbi:PREDICTED: cell surface glycoprotein MUC18-like [Amphimedon queenslandica]|uniref:Ig-like domain-containing protein n=1 Tax=Amphimedon queenslandica TaxID=400682 RepID=A0A1X7UR72_AMPQE|nr:PREDICTED: cell surface glycoprotein MUC18-like [Amphimedon queenslandica]|eukprot:XP_019852938.1 PREDICTED: cell surface glycoprotein MUC18-like [Amphimedon queenslandica]
MTAVLMNNLIVIFSAALIFFQIQNCSPVSAPMEDIVFKDGSISVVTLGPDNIESSISINCTVLNNGSFQLDWLHNDQQLFGDRVMIDITRRSTKLQITNISFHDEGVYTCIVYRQNDPREYQKNFKVELKATLRSHPTASSCHDNIGLSCEMSGYLRPEIKWMENNTKTISNSEQYTVLTTAGRNQTSINTKGDSSTSVVSILSIHDPLKVKDSSFTCSVPGTDLNITLPFTLNTSTHHEDLTSIVPPLSTSPSSSSPVSTVLVTLLSILGLVTILLCISVLSLVTATFYCKSKETRKEVPSNIVGGTLQSVILTNNAAYSSALTGNVETETIYEEIKTSQDEDYDDGYI